MNTTTCSFTLVLALAAAPFLSGSSLEEDQEASAFLSHTIDVGCVVSDVDASVAFYTEALGFTELPGFGVPADFCTDAGLTNGKPLEIRVLALGKGPSATKLKLMQVAGERASSDNSYVDAQLGFSYITLVVKDTGAALERLARAGVEPIAKGPVTLPASLDPSLALTIVRDPDGNLVELVGPRPQAR